MALTMKITSKFGTEHPEAYIKVLGARIDNTQKKVTARVVTYISKEAYEGGMDPLDGLSIQVPLELNPAKGDNLIKQVYKLMTSMDEYKSAKEA